MARNFGLKKKELAPPRILDAVNIYDACAATSERLNTLLGTHDIEVRLAGMGNDHIEGNLVGGWLGARFHWHCNLGSFNPYNQTFCLGLFKGYNLCAMLESGLKVTARQRISLDIKFIEGHPYPEENDLRGYVIPSFAEATRQIAQTSGIGFIGVDQPSRKTVPQYKRLGYSRYFWDDLKLMKDVNGAAELNWEALLVRRKKQGFALAA